MGKHSCASLRHRSRSKIRWLPLLAILAVRDIIVHMLSLKSDTTDRWFRQVEQDLESVLIDHAHCERKAAGTAMSLLTAYVVNEELCRRMTEIVNEELEHFHMVLELLSRRGIPFRRIPPSSYGKRLHLHVAKKEPQRVVDRLLVASLIEARSCERFSRLSEYVQDPELVDFYASLFESEARHHTTYVQLAYGYSGEAEVHQRLDELADVEAKIIAEGDPFARMHS